ncbi:MAG: isochorismatase family protein [Deltaproteobacteria bacterium]|nr:MAG: isochorismatase family protein [Deltaproteobacteria bacterium]
MSNDLGKFNLDAEKAVLVVIDVQERLVPAMPEDVYLRLRNTVAMLVEVAGLLGLPVVTTEQYPKGIGHTVPELAAACNETVIEKVSFGCCGEASFLQALKNTGRTQVLITGMEAHVCVYQTVLGLLEDGYYVHLIRDAICSRNKTDYLAGVANAGQAGAVVTTAETVMFQMLQESTHEQFRAVSRLVKERG